MSNYATRAYTNVSVHTNVEGASPHKLIVMLYDELLKQLRLGKAHMVKRELGAKATCISRALRILDQGLMLSLDHQTGGEIAANMHAIYDYCQLRMLHANLHNDVGSLDEVIRLIDQLRTTWLEIAPVSPPRAAQGAAR